MCKAINEIMNEWAENRVVIDIADEKDKVMTRNQNWAFVARVVGNFNEKVELLTKVKTIVNMHELKNRVWEKCEAENMQMSKKH